MRIPCLLLILAVVGAASGCESLSDYRTPQTTGKTPAETGGAASQPANAPTSNQAPKPDAETADLQRAVGIGVSALHEQSHDPVEGYTLTSAQQIVVKDRYTWRITFKPTRLLPKDPSKGHIGAGGEVFVDIDSITHKPEIRFGE